MGAIDHLAIELLGADDARAGVGAVRRSALESERSGLAVFPDTRNGVRHSRRRWLLDRNRGAAALRLRQRMDRHGAGHRKLAPPRPCDTVDGHLHQRRSRKQGLATWLDATPAGATVYGPLGFTPTLQLRRLRYAGPATAAAPNLAPEGTLDAMIARDRRAMGFDRSAFHGELADAPGSKSGLARRGAMALIATAARRDISDRYSPMTPPPPPRWSKPSRARRSAQF